MPRRPLGVHRIRNMSRVKTFFCAAAIALPFAAMPVARAQSPAPAPRTVVPIRQMTLSDGTIRYWVPVKIGGTIVHALLDTGSTGLRLLPNVMSGAHLTDGPNDHVSFLSGTEFLGTVARVTVGLGGLSGESTVQVIKTVKCSDGSSNCPVARMPLNKYGIGANGLPGEGFRALIGIKPVLGTGNMGPSEIANPLVAIGAKRWIVELPRAGSSSPGRLVLNPRDEEIATYVSIPLLAHFRYSQPLHDAIQGCVQRLNGNGKACGAMVFDTGNPALHVFNAPIGLRLGLGRGSRAKLTIFDGTKARAVAIFKVQRANTSQLFLFTHGYAYPFIFAGVMPYLAFHVLYNSDKSEIGLKPRAIVPGLPAGRLVRSN